MPEPVVTDESTESAVEEALVSAGTEPVLEESVANEGIETLPESWQAEIKSLRKEAADRRVAAKSFEAFDSFDAADRTFLLDLVRDLSSTDTQGAAAQRMKDVAERLLSGDITEEEAVDELQEDEGDKPLTVNEWKKMQADEQASTAQSKAIAEIEAEAKELGYEPDTAEWTLLMYNASHATQGDLAAAHKLIEDNKQVIIDAWVENQKANGAKWIIPVNGSETGAPDTNPIKNLSDSKKSLIARLSAV